MAAPGSTTELIKEKLDIIQFLRGYLNLQPAGKNFKALCPFHREKTPSFMVSPERQSWHCFGCGLGGDVFGFLMRYENVDFGEALRTLAERAGVELRRLNPAEYKFAGLLFELQNAAKDFFRSALQGSAPAKKYLAERGLKPETVDEFEIGWAPRASESLVLHILNLGYAPDDVIRAGLALKNERGLLYDRFRGRIMFPIHNGFGKVVGFTGRILPQYDTGEAGKYVNSPETPIFNKSKILYGFHKSKNFIRDARSAFLVEGQMDFLACWQAGLRNAVASSGTALTAEHLRAIKRLTDELYLSFDADEAGGAAAERAIDLAESADMSVKIVTFGNFKDAAEAAQAGPEKVTSAVAQAVDAPIFYFQRYLKDLSGPDFARREGLRSIRLVLSKIKNIPSPIGRNFWIQELSRKTGLDEKILIEEEEKLEPSVSETVKAASGEEAAAERRAYSRKELVSERLLQLAATTNNFALLDDCTEYLPVLHRKALEILRSGGRRAESPELDEVLDLIILGTGNVALDDASELKRELIKEYVKEKRQEITMALKHAESIGDDAKIMTFLEELKNLPSTVFES